MPMHVRAMAVDPHALVKFHPVLKAYLSPRMANDSEVEDIVQETIIRFWMASTRQELSSPAGYLFQIARNLLIDHSRRRSPLKDALPIEEGMRVGIEAQQESGRNLADLQQAYERALAELPERCREIFILRRHSDLPTSEIAAKLNITTRMVQKYLVRTMLHLQERLRPFLTCDHSFDDDRLLSVAAAGGASVPTRFHSVASSW